ncbi:MAG: tRNA epoxyqueuosine(34) reductase QueG [Thermoflexales bacterium]|nr:tRNA epoxyqueuosine(34) reductase QueG [Thermoflexales bacterium]
MNEFAKHIKQHAHSLGFELCGIAVAGEAETHPRYVEWLASGYHAQMDYLARSDAVARRADLRTLWPPARSIVVVGTNYYTSSQKAAAFGRSSFRGAAVARYAWGPDYHRVMASRLKKLAAWIEAATARNSVSLRNRASRKPLHSKICVDTSPVLEREWAVRAGLGWIGKNTMLIHPRLGSWLLLGELLLDIELPPDPPFAASHCGTCTRCIDACPTGCILPERVLAANRCLAYLTIESRAEIPAELAAAVGKRIFGCDVCQEVCPWNRFARHSTGVDPNPAWVALDPAEIAAMSEEAFQAQFAGSAIRRAGRLGLARNAAVVIKNECMPPLE